jgi:hypothetical protein
LHERPVILRLPRQPQGEGITVVRGAVVVDSERTHSAVFALRMPRARATGRKPAIAEPTPARAVAPTQLTDSNTSLFWIVGGAGVGLALLAVGVGLAARRGR